MVYEYCHTIPYDPLSPAFIILEVNRPPMPSQHNSSMINTRRPTKLYRFPTIFDTLILRSIPVLAVAIASIIIFLNRNDYKRAAIKQLAYLYILYNHFRSPARLYRELIPLHAQEHCASHSLCRRHSIRSKPRLYNIVLRLFRWSRQFCDFSRNNP